MLKQITNVLLYPFKLIALGLIGFYKILISPLLPRTCIYTPTCSTYAFNAIQKHGFFLGSILACKRICRCTPKHQGGHDPVPLNLKGEDKWLF
jgi:putative membrane protein insertion efficiency factor